MKPVLLPTPDVNSEHGVITAWFVAERERVAACVAIGEIETSKSIIEVESPGEGLLLHAAEVGAEVPLSEPVAYLFDDIEELEAFATQLGQRGEPRQGDDVRASRPAIRRAQELGVDLGSLKVDGLITTEIVEAAAASQSPVRLPDPLALPGPAPRVGIIGAGMGANQIIDILRSGVSGAPVAIVDDDRGRWGDEVMGVPVVGGFDRFVALFEEGAFDAALIAIATSVAARVRFREACERAGIPMANAIDPTARIGAEVSFGTGNVVCAFCHFGMGTTVGDNNFFSAFNSFDHHNRLGSDISSGPACVTSGVVTVGDRVRFGMGIRVEPHISIGSDVAIASGATILRSVPPKHVVKRRSDPMSVVPLRSAGT